MRPLGVHVTLLLFVAASVGGCCRGRPDVLLVAADPVPPRCSRELPAKTRRAIHLCLRVGMTFDEVRAALRPFADGEPGGLGSLGLVTFGLRDGDLHLRFEVDGGPTTVFLDGPGTGSFTDRIPPYIAGTIQDRLVAGGDFDPTRGS